MTSRVLMFIGVIAVIGLIVSNPAILQDAVNLLSAAVTAIKGAFK